MKAAATTEIQNAKTRSPAAVAVGPSALSRLARCPIMELATMPTKPRPPHRGPGNQGKSSANPAACVSTANCATNPMATMAPHISVMVGHPATYIELRDLSRVACIDSQPWLEPIRSPFASPPCIRHLALSYCKLVYVINHEAEKCNSGPADGPRCQVGRPRGDSLYSVAACGSGEDLQLGMLRRGRGMD